MGKAELKEKHWHDHWDNHAKQWSLIGSPLRPCAEDIQIIKRAISQCADNGLLLGVTPELAAISPNITAVDHNIEMINNLAGKNKATFAKWQELPFEAESFDYIIGDGSFSMLNYTRGYLDVSAQLAKVAKPKARLAFRLFAAPADAEAISNVKADALGGKIQSFHTFKWRFAMALTAENNNPNIRVQDIFNRFEKEFPNRAELAEKSGWYIEHINTINVYNNSDITYSFPTLIQFLEAAASLWEAEDVEHGSYELASCCPIITLTKK